MVNGFREDVKHLIKEHPNWDLSFEYGTCSEADAGKTVTQDVSASADVYMFANDQLQTLIDANAISELGGSTADYVKSTNSQAVVDSITVDGGIYGVPFTTNTWFLYYNKKVYSDSDVKSLDTMLEKKEKLLFLLQTAGIMQHSILQTDVHYSVMVQITTQESILAETMERLLQITL